MLQLISFLEEAYLPVFTFGADRPLTCDDVKDYKVQVENKFCKILTQLVCVEKQLSLEACNDVRTRTNVVVAAILLCGQHSSPRIWTTSRSILYSEALLGKLLKCIQIEKLSELLVMNNEEMLKLVLKKLRPFILSSTWQYYPGAVLCYSWVVRHVNEPHLGEHLDMVLPTSLMLVDNFVNENKILGMETLKHIICNVTRTELVWKGRSDVIYAALKPSLYHNNVDMIEPVFSCVAALLDKIHPPSLSSADEWSEADEVLGNMLQKMSLLNTTEERLAYISSLPKIVSVAGLVSVRHCQELLDVLKEYICYTSFAIKTVEAMEMIVEVCWPRLPPPELMEICLLFLERLTTGYEEADPVVLLALSELMVTLCRLSPPLILTLRLYIPQGIFPSLFYDTVNGVISSAEQYTH